MYQFDCNYILIIKIKPAALPTLHMKVPVSLLFLPFPEEWNLFPLKALEILLVINQLILNLHLFEPTSITTISSL